MSEAANPVLRHYDMPTNQLDDYLVQNIQDKFVHGGELHGMPILDSTKKPIPRSGGVGKPEGMTDFEWNKHVSDKYLPLDRDYVDALNAHRELTGQPPIPEGMLREPYGGLDKDETLEALIAGSNMYDANLETALSSAPRGEYLLPRAAADARVLSHPVMSDTQRRLRYLNPLGW